ncbi:hypothetical protein QW060_21845 [Myroides ceti]|uniref:Uncharacterized protein n=1 Tax=Paenimyroides ceti TaxID=395087 RepID=A0ABT8CT82_9FLAO|nr:hypothetical protein [Paenimyroides ceti]MDN3707191.1 hypothetical protein [Paenimyroides ceti]MDN3709613.1 hypothetical protein [Paenimyroides ceti]
MFLQVQRNGRYSLSKDLFDQQHTIRDKKYCVCDGIVCPYFRWFGVKRNKQLCKNSTFTV